MSTSTTKRPRNATTAVRRSVQRSSRVYLAVEPRLVEGWVHQAHNLSSELCLIFYVSCSSFRSRKSRVWDAMYTYILKKLTSAPNGGSRQASGLTRPPEPASRHPPLTSTSPKKEINNKLYHHSHRKSQSQLGKPVIMGRPASGIRRPASGVRGVPVALGCPRTAHGASVGRPWGVCGVSVGRPWGVYWPCVPMG